MIHTFTLLLAQASAATPAPGGATSSPLSQFVPFIAMAVIFYFLLIRPQQKRAREHNALIAAVKSGDDVVMSSGIHGMVTNVKERTLIIKVADNVKMEFDKSAVAQVVKPTTTEG